jgi:hypothetical protein
VLPPHDILVGVVVPDYVLTVLVAAIQRRPAYLLLGLGFVPLRCLDAWLCLRSLWRTRSAQSVGTWTSPQRRTPTGSPVLSAVQATSPPPATPPPAVPSPAPRIADGSPLPIPNPRPRQQQPAPALTHASPWEHLGRIPDAKACPDCPWQSMAGG